MPRRTWQVGPQGPPYQGLATQSVIGSATGFRNFSRIPFRPRCDEALQHGKFNVRPPARYSPANAGRSQAARRPAKATDGSSVARQPTGSARPRPLQQCRLPPRPPHRQRPQSTHHRPHAPNGTDFAAHHRPLPSAPSVDSDHGTRSTATARQRRPQRPPLQEIANRPAVPSRERGAPVNDAAGTRGPRARHGRQMFLNGRKTPPEATVAGLHTQWGTRCKLGSEPGARIVERTSTHHAREGNPGRPSAVTAYRGATHRARARPYSSPAFHVSVGRKTTHRSSRPPPLHLGFPLGLRID